MSTTQNRPQGLQSLTSHACPSRFSICTGLQFIPKVSCPQNYGAKQPLFAGTYFATSCNGFDGEGCEVCFWDRRQLKLIWQGTGHQQATKACIFLPADCTMPCLPDSTPGTDQADHHAEDHPASALALPCAKADASNGNLLKSEAGLLLASASADSTVKIWQLGQDKERRTMPAHCKDSIEQFTCLALSTASQQPPIADQDANFLLAGNFAGQLQSWDM